MTRPHNWRVYLIGYREVWVAQNILLCQRLMRECDFAAVAPFGIPVGQMVGAATIVPGRECQKLPETIVCLRHEYDGKVIIVQEPSKA